MTGWQVQDIRPDFMGNPPYRAIARFVRPPGEPGPGYILFGDGPTAYAAREAALAACHADAEWKGVMP